MASTSETGHAKNVTNFEELITFCTSYGSSYNPSKASIKLTALQTLLTNSKNAINAVNAAIPAYSNAVAAREVAFEPLKKLITRVINALQATDTSKQVDENARSLVRKIQGKRATAKLTEEEKKELSAQGKEKKEISTAQTSFDSRLDNFDKFIKLLSSISQYVPNEDDLKVTSLTTFYNNLKAKNNAVINAAIPLSNARIARNDILYKTNTGMVDTALDVKLYIKSLYGAGSPHYKQVSGIEFKNIKI